MPSQSQVMQSVLALVATGCAALATVAAAPAAQTPHRLLITTSDGYGGPSAVEVLDQRGRVERVIAREEADPDWSPDGRLSAAWAPGGKLVAWVDRDGVNVAAADGSDKRQVAKEADDCRTGCIRPNFAWSPDGRRLAIGGTGAKANRLLVVTVADGSSTDIAPDDEWTNYTALGWTGDGRSVVYRRSSGELGSADCCEADLRVTTADGKRTRVAYTFEDSLLLGSVDSLSPDGRKLAYTPIAGNGVVDIVDVTRGRLTSIKLPRRVGPATPAWSPDSRRIALATLDGQVIAVAAAGGAIQTIARFGRSNLWPYWTRYDDLVVVRGARRTEIWVSSGGSRMRKRFDVQAGIDTLDGA